MKALLFRHRRLILSALTAVFYGGLAYLANHDQGQHAALKAALVQSAASTALVLVSSILMEFFFALGNTVVEKYCYSFFMSGFVVLGINLLAHWLSGTPNLFMTLLYSALASLPYYIIYPYILARHYLSEQQLIRYEKSHEKH